MRWFVIGFVLGVVLEYQLQSRTVDREARHIREAEDTAELAWSHN